MSRLTHLVFGPLHLDRVHTVLDCHGLDGHPTEQLAVLAARHKVLPVVLDMSTDNLTLRGDDLYLGARTPGSGTSTTMTLLTRSSPPSPNCSPTPCCTGTTSAPVRPVAF